MDNNTYLENEKTVFIIKFRVKEDAVFGIKTFELKPVNMLDTDANVYNVNNGQSVVGHIPLGDYAVVEGTVGLYLGDEGSGLNAYILNKLNQEALNKALENTQFSLRKNISETTNCYNGYQLFIPDSENNIAVKNYENQIIGVFRINIEDLSNKILSIAGNGFINRDTYIDLEQGETFYIGNETIPFMLYPGDIGRIKENKLVLEADGKINNVDFSAWLKVFKEHLEGIASPDDIVKADFTRDGTIDNVDFSLWLASYKKLLSEPVEEFEDGEGMVVANEHTALTEASAPANPGEVIISTFDEQGFERYCVYNIGSTNAGDYLGYKVKFKAAVDINKNKKVLMDIKPEGNKTLGINGFDIEYVYENESKIVVEYGIDRDKDYVPKSVYINSSAKLIYNGKARPLDTEVLTPSSGELLLIENDSDNVFDIVKVSEYDYFIVDYVDTARHKIYSKISSGIGGYDSIEVDPEKSDIYKFSITKDGQPIDINDINEWDVLAVASDTPNVSGDGFDRAKLINIIVLNNTVEGRVTEYYEGDYYTEYFIDGKKYIANPHANLAGVGLDTEAIFYLDLYGRIIYADASMKQFRNYVYLIETGLDTVFGISTAQFKVLTSNGEIHVYNGSSAIRYTDSSGNQQIYRKSAGGHQLTHLDLVGADDHQGALEEGQLITIKLISEGEITTIESARDYALVFEFSKFSEGNMLYRNGLLDRIYIVNADTIVFEIPDGTDYTGYCVRRGDILLDAHEYNVVIYDVSNYGEVAVMILKEREQSFSNSLALVDRKMLAVNDEGYTVNSIYALSDGEWINRLDDGVAFEMVGPGDAILINTDVKGYVNDVVILFKPNSDGSSLSFEKWNNSDEYDPYAKLYTAYGEVMKRGAGYMIADINGVEVRFSTTGSMIYRYDFARSSNRTSIVSMGEIRQKTPTEDGDMVFIRMDDREVKEIVIYRY